MTTITYLRPSGTTLTVNDEPSIRAWAEAQGWTEVGAKPEKAPKKLAEPKEKPAKLATPK